jgi:CheY-like chemotaxis protein
MKMNPNHIIICLDDEKIILDSLRGELIRNFGRKYNYEFVDNPSEAIDMIREYQEDNETVILVITDWLMPEMKGDEFMIQVFRLYPQIAMIMLTGQADESAILRAKNNANLFKCISKPWNEKELVSSIQQAIQPTN